MTKFDDFLAIVKNTNTYREIGKVLQIIGLIIEADGPKSKIGDLCYIYNTVNTVPIAAEVVGFRQERVLLMPLGSI